MTWKQFKKAIAIIILIWGLIGLIFFLIWNGVQSLVPEWITKLSIVFAIIIIALNIGRVLRND